MNEYNLLPLNFHQTFIPERRYVSVLLEVIEDRFETTDKELSELTGIPMGISSGKLPAILAYAKGMGLISIKNGPKKKISLTELGEIVKLEDLFLNEELTQWLCHFELCKKTTGTELWYQIFSRSFQNFSSSFSIKQLELFLEQQFGRSNRPLIGPAIRTYFEDASLSLVDVITLVPGEKDIYNINTPPLIDSFSFLYSYILLSLWEETIELKNDLQVTITDFNSSTELFNMLNLNSRQLEVFLSLIEAKNVIEIDKQMKPWILKKKCSAASVISKIYDLL